MADIAATIPDLPGFATEPLCCGEPMVHNSWTSEYECATAYFALVDAGFGESVLDLLTVDEVSSEVAATLLHWRESRISDGRQAVYGSYDEMVSAQTPPRPQRIQLSRARGWRKPADAIVVARPTCWGNPVRVDPANPRGRLVAVQRFSLYLTIRRQTGSDPFGYPSDERIRAELAGRDLCCWCPTDGPCHADILLARANAREVVHA